MYCVNMQRSPKQVLLVLDVYQDLPVAEIWSLLPESEEKRELFVLSKFGAPQTRHPYDKQLDWGYVVMPLVRMAETARDMHLTGGVEVNYYVCGLAPLPLFYQLGRVLAHAGNQTFVNRRKGGNWDVLPLASNSTEGDFFDVVEGLQTHPVDGNPTGLIALFVSTMGGAPPNKKIDAFFEQRNQAMAGLVEIRTSTNAIIDSGNIDRLAGHLERVLPQISLSYPDARGVVVFIAGAAQLAFLVGRLLPDTLGEIWLTNFLGTSRSYMPAYQIGIDPRWSGVVAIQAVQITNLRLFKKLSLTVKEPRPKTGQWAIVIGENGAGKTTFLRTIALALTGRQNAASVLGDARSQYIRNGESSANCRVQLYGEGGRYFFNVTIQTKEEGDGEIVTSSDGSTGGPWVVAYGCRRGGAIGGDDPERAKTHFADVATLFDDDRGLIGVESWLSTQHSAMYGGDSGAKVAYETIVSVLEDLLKCKFLPWRSDGLWVQPVGGSEVRFAALSDGYLTTAGWVVDLMVRYVEKNRGKKVLSENVTQEMEGLVLIDEIDLHLHPRWQIRLVRELRKLFPRMSFIATTHNPLTLAGAHKEEVFILRENEGKEPVIEPVAFDPRLRTGTELYAKFFGIDGLFPDELGRALHRYGLLASNPYRRDDEEQELQEIIDLLKKADVKPTFSPEERIPRQ
jgi:predicted ATPase